MLLFTENRNILYVAYNKNFKIHTVFRKKKEKIKAYKQSSQFNSIHLKIKDINI